MSSILISLEALIKILSQKLWVVVAIFGVFVFAVIRRRQLKRILEEEELLLRRSEEESVLARRTLDFAHSTPDRVESPSAHVLPPREVFQEAAESMKAETDSLSDSSPLLSSQPTARPFDAQEDDESKVLEEQPLDIIGGNAESEISSESLNNEAQVDTSPKPEVRSEDYQRKVSIEETERRSVQIRTEFLEGNRKTLEDLSHLVAVSYTHLTLPTTPYV